MRTPEKDKNPAEIVDLSRPEVAPIDRSWMWIEQENFVRSQHFTSLPGRHFPAQSVGIHGVRDVDSTHENRTSFPANFIAR